MNVLIIGRGAIGTKHRATLEKLAPRFELTIFVFEPTTRGARYFAELNHALATHRIDAAFICNPTSMHVKTALVCARFGTHIFLEKPLSAVWDKKAFTHIERLITQKQLTFMVGYDMRFNPWILKVKEILDAKTLGNIWGVRIMAGQYLPSWRPGTDYHTGYGAKKALGGGVLLDLSHELDYLLWFLPQKVKQVSAHLVHSGILKIETEDIASLQIEYANQTVAHVHLDYLALPYRRSLELYGTKGTVLWDDNAKHIRLYADGAWKMLKVSRVSDTGPAIFAQELAHFFESIHTKRVPRNSLTNAIAVMRLVDAARRSAHTRRAVSMRGI